MFRNIHLGGKTKEKWEVVAIKGEMVVTLAEGWWLRRAFRGTSGVTGKFSNHG